MQPSACYTHHLPPPVVHPAYLHSLPVSLYSSCIYVSYKMPYLLHTTTVPYLSLGHAVTYRKEPAAL